MSALLLACLVPFTAPAKSDSWQLHRNYLGSSGIEVDAGGVDADGLGIALGAPTQRFLEAGQGLHMGGQKVDEPRIILRTAADFPPSFESALERMQFGWSKETPHEFSFFGRRYQDAADGFVATFEDPDRAGLPVTIWFANSEDALLAYAKSLEPQSKPGFRCFQSGELELSGVLGTNAELLTAKMLNRRTAWAERFRLDQRVKIDGFTCRVPVGVSVERASAYLKTVARTRRRALTWAAPGEHLGESPVNAIGETHVVVHGHVEDMSSLVGVHELSVVNPITGTVHVVVADGIADDAGAAVGESSLRSVLGAPREAWMGPAAGVAIAGQWWGRDLEKWGSRLHTAGVVPPLDELLGVGNKHFLSPHVRGPMSALFLAHLLRQRGLESFPEIWNGTVSLDLSAEEGAWRAWLDSLVPHVGHGPSKIAGTWRAGCVFVPEPIGYGARLVGQSLDDLKARDASAISLRVFAYRDRPEAELPGRLHPPQVWARESDLALASAATAAQARGFEVGLDMHALVNPGGGRVGDLAMHSAEQLSAFFERYERMLIHEALVAELIGAERFSVGTGLLATSMPVAEQAGLVRTSPPGRIPEMNALREQGWRGLLQLTKRLFDGRVLYTVSGTQEARSIPFADELDLLAVELFPVFEGRMGKQATKRGQAPIAKLLTLRIANDLKILEQIADERGIQLMIKSVGFASTDEAWLHAAVPRGKVSPETQALLYRCLASACHMSQKRQPGLLVGLLIWNWSAYPGAGGLADRGYSPQGKPAAELLARLFATATPK